MRRFGGVEGAGMGPNGGLPPTKRPRTNAAAAAAAAGSSIDNAAAFGSGSSSVGAVSNPQAPTTLRQLAPRGRGSGAGSQGGLGSRGGQGATAAGGSSSMGAAAAAAAAGTRSEHTPRPMDLGSMVPAEHDFAPREGELAGIGEGDEVEVAAGAPRHFISGGDVVTVWCGVD